MLILSVLVLCSTEVWLSRLGQAPDVRVGPGQLSDQHVRGTRADEGYGWRAPATEPLPAAVPAAAATAVAAVAPTFLRIPPVSAAAAPAPPRVDNFT